MHKQTHIRAYDGSVFIVRNGARVFLEGGVVLRCTVVQRLKEGESPSLSGANRRCGSNVY